MQKITGVDPSLSPSSSDTDSLLVPASAAHSPATPAANPSFPSPTSTCAEPQTGGECACASHVQGTEAYPEEGRRSVSSNSGEEAVRQHVCHVELQALDASRDDTIDQASQGGDVNPRCVSNGANPSQLCMDIYADMEKGRGFATVKHVDGEEEGHGECCRVCHLSAEKSPSSGDVIKLGCACKDDLALAHRLCAETWFKLKGNQTCEICGSTAQNIFICGSTAQNILGSGGASFIEHWDNEDANRIVPTRAERCWQNQPICNTVLVCVILVLIASWLFRVTVF